MHSAQVSGVCLTHSGSSSAVDACALATAWSAASSASSPASCSPSTTPSSPSAAPLRLAACSYLCRASEPTALPASACAWGGQERQQRLHSMAARGRQPCSPARPHVTTSREIMAHLINHMRFYCLCSSRCDAQASKNCCLHDPTRAKRYPDSRWRSGQRRCAYC